MKYQCYYSENGERCKNEQEDCWCSPEHKVFWQQENYGSREQQQAIDRIKEYRRQVEEMKKNIICIKR